MRGADTAEDVEAGGDARMDAGIERDAASFAVLVAGVEIVGEVTRGKPYVGEARSVGPPRREAEEDAAADLERPALDRCVLDAARAPNERERIYEGDLQLAAVAIDGGAERVHLDGRMTNGANIVVRIVFFLRLRGMSGRRSGKREDEREPAAHTKSLRPPRREGNDTA